MGYKTNRLISSQKIRFAAVGGVNTLTDFTVLFSLVVFLGVPALLANGISTSTALAVSYMLNKKAVFKVDERNRLRQILIFVGVTLFGLWVIQGGVIWAMSVVLASASIDNPITLFIAKLIASLFSLVWNYIWYSKVIFSKRNIKEQ